MCRVSKWARPIRSFEVLLAAVFLLALLLAQFELLLFVLIVAFASICFALFRCSFAFFCESELRFG